MTLEIHVKNGKPYLKKVDRYRNSYIDGRGNWVPIGRSSDTGIERIIEANRQNGLMVLIDEDGVYRALVCSD